MFPFSRLPVGKFQSWQIDSGTRLYRQNITEIFMQQHHEKEQTIKVAISRKHGTLKKTVSPVGGKLAVKISNMGQECIQSVAISLLFGNRNKLMPEALKQAKVFCELLIRGTSVLLLLDLLRPFGSLKQGYSA